MSISNSCRHPLDLFGLHDRPRTVLQGSSTMNLTGRQFVVSLLQPTAGDSGRQDPLLSDQVASGHFHFPDCIEQHLIDRCEDAVMFAQRNDFSGKHIHLGFSAGLHILKHGRLSLGAEAG